MINLHLAANLYPLYVFYNYKTDQQFSDTQEKDNDARKPILRFYIFHYIWQFENVKTYTKHRLKVC